MQLQEFCDKRIGTKVDYDGAYGYQCVDLFRQYCADVWHIPQFRPVDGAVDLWRQSGNPGVSFEKEPRPGDAAIWHGTPSNIYGHVAIVLFATVGTLVVLEQNGIRQDGVKIVVRNNDVLGYIRKV